MKRSFLTISISSILLSFGFTNLTVNAITPYDYCRNKYAGGNYGPGITTSDMEKLYSSQIEWCVRSETGVLNRLSQIQKSLLTDYKKVIEASSDEEFAKLQISLEKKWGYEGIKFTHNEFYISNFPKIRKMQFHLFGDLRKRRESIIEKERKAGIERRRAEWEAGRPERERRSRELQQLQAKKDREFWTKAGKVVSVRSVREMRVGLTYGYRLVDKSYVDECSLFGGSCGSTVYTMMK